MAKKKRNSESKADARNRRIVGLPPINSKTRNERFKAQVDLKKATGFLKVVGGEKAVRQFKKKAGLIEQPTRGRMHPNTPDEEVSKIVRRRKARKGK